MRVTYAKQYKKILLVVKVHKMCECINVQINTKFRNEVTFCVWGNGVDRERNGRRDFSHIHNAFLMGINISGHCIFSS